MKNGENVRCVMCEIRVGGVWLISWLVVGNLREISRRSWKMCAELWGPESGWMNFGGWTRKERWHCCWENGWMAYVYNRVMEDVGECVVYWLGR